MICIFIYLCFLSANKDEICIFIYLCFLSTTSKDDRAVHRCWEALHQQLAPQFVDKSEGGKNMFFGITFKKALM